MASSRGTLSQCASPPSVGDSGACPVHFVGAAIRGGASTTASTHRNPSNGNTQSTETLPAHHLGEWMRETLPAATQFIAQLLEVPPPYGLIVSINGIRSRRISDVPILADIDTFVDHRFDRESLLPPAAILDEVTGAVDAENEVMDVVW